MAKDEEVLYSGKFGRVVIIRYLDGGEEFYDLMTDGRMLLSPARARKIASKLLAYAEGK